MALEDFERELAQKQAEKSERKRHRSRSRSPHKHRERHHHRHHHHSSRRKDDAEARGRRDSHRQKRSRHDEKRDRDRRHSSRSPADLKQNREEEEREDEEDDWVEKETHTELPTESARNDGSPVDQEPTRVKRDTWMEDPAALEVDYIHRAKPPPKAPAPEAPKMILHDNELNYQLKAQLNGEQETTPGQASEVSTQQAIDYTFGDAGSSWRMTKLKGVYRQAKESGKSVEDVAVERFGNLRAFDDAREEEIELDRRTRYGKDYIGKEKPTGELFKERRDDSGMNDTSKAENDESEDEFEAVQNAKDTSSAPRLQLDQSALNKLKAQMMRAKLKGGPEFVELEAQYKAATAGGISTTSTPAVVTLNKMENRMLVGGRKGEVKQVETTRGRGRGNVVESEDMSIEDMVRQERRTRGTQFSNSGRAYAERIAKDAKFDTDHDYLDENASKLAAAVHKSDTHLRSMAVEDYQKLQRALATCPLCYHEDTSTPPQAPIVSLGTRVYLTLPPSPEITPYGLCTSIVPIQHRSSLLECDDDEWEELRNFMKSLSRFYYAQTPPLGVVFYENAAHISTSRSMRHHAALEAVPLPLDQAEQAPAFFREAILVADEEWSQHRKLIDTLSRAKGDTQRVGLGKAAFRRSMVAELPYFHVWFNLDGGIGHVVEDVARWPRGDLFAREILGGMLDVAPEVIKKQGRWRRGDADMEKRVKGFRRGWEKWDWTAVLTQEA